MVRHFGQISCKRNPNHIVWNCQDCDFPCISQHHLLKLFFLNEVRVVMVKWQGKSMTKLDFIIWYNIIINHIIYHNNISWSVLSGGLTKIFYFISSVGNYSCRCVIGFFDRSLFNICVYTLWSAYLILILSLKSVFILIFIL